MIVKLHDIEESIAVRGTMDGSRYKRPDDVDLSFESPIEYELTVSKMGTDVRINGPIRCTLKLSCDRCLEAFSCPVSAYLDIGLAPKADEAKPAELELKSEDLNLYFFEGDELELEPYVYEEVMLGVPIKALCGDACKGMCPVCGKNQNIETCECGKSRGTSLAEKLQAFPKDR
jgi:uncharacterized protein